MATTDRIQALSLEQFQFLAEALLDFQGADDLAPGWPRFNFEIDPTSCCIALMELQGSVEAVALQQALLEAESGSCA